MPLELRSSARRLQRVVGYLEGNGGWVALAVASGCSIALLLYLGRGTTFYLDEITIFAESKGFDLRYLLSPHDGQLILLARLVYSGVFHLFGADYLVLRVINSCGVAVVAALLYALVRRRVGGALALPAALIVLFFGTGWEVVLSPVGILNVYCLAAGLGALLVLDSGWRFADVAACALLVVSVSSYSFGVAVSVGVAVLILARPDRWRRAWVFAVPLLLYAAWTVAKPSLAGPLSGATGFDLADIGTFPAFAAESFAHVMGAIFGLNYNFAPQNPALAPPSDSWGVVLATVIVAWAAWRARRRAPSTMAWALIAILIVFWLGITVASGFSRPPWNGRYLYPGAIVVILLAAELARGIRVTPRLAVAAFAVAAVSLAANLAYLRDASNFLRPYSESTRADLSAIEIARGQVSPLFIPAAGVLTDPRLAASVQPRRYVPAVARNGSFALSLEELRAAPEADRADADAILGQAYSLHAVAAPALRSLRACVEVESTDFALPRGGALIRASQGGELSLRRFADASTVQVGIVGAGRVAAIRIPPDRAPERWRGTMTPAQPIRLCPL